VLLLCLLLLFLRRWDCKPQRSRGAQRSSCFLVSGAGWCLDFGWSRRLVRDFTDALRSLRSPRGFTDALRSPSRVVRSESGKVKSWCKSYHTPSIVAKLAIIDEHYEIKALLLLICKSNTAAHASDNNNNKQKNHTRKNNRVIGLEEGWQRAEANVKPSWRACCVISFSPQSCSQ